MKLVVAIFPSFTRIFIPKLQCAPSARDLGKSLKLFSHPKCYAFIRLSIKWPLPVRDRPCARHQEHHSKQDWHDLCLHGTYSLRWEMESIQIIYNYNEWWNKRSRVQWWRIMREAMRVYLQRVSREGLSMKGTQKQETSPITIFLFQVCFGYKGFFVFPCSAIKRNDIGSCTETWMDLVCHTEWSESEREKNKYHILTHICGI